MNFYTHVSARLGKEPPPPFMFPVFANTTRNARQNARFEICSSASY